MTRADRLIAVAGEALVDLVLEPDGTATPHLGGGSFNAARTLGRLGLRPVFICRLSTDRYGCALRAGLVQSGVELDGIVTTDDPTTFARVEIDAGGVAGYRFYLNGTSSAGLSAREARAAMPSRAEALHVGGLGLAVEPQASAIFELVSGAGPDMLVFVDPNCRPGAVRDPRAYRSRLSEVLARADIVKASEEDLAYLDPDLPPFETARRLLRHGPRLVLITHGGHGVSILSAGWEDWIVAPGADVVDTIGAGDAFGAAWLGAWVAEGLGREQLGDLDAVVRTTHFAALVAARTCERAGAEPPAAEKVGPRWSFASGARTTPALSDGS